MTPTTKKPTRPGGCSSTGTTPAATHASWNRVSNCAKARPRLASGASLCRIDSKANLPIAAEKLTDDANRTPPSTPPSTDVPAPATAMIASAATNIVSSRIRLRMNGAMALPAMVSKLAKAIDRPNQMRPASWRRNQKNKWKNVNPTVARASSIADEASTTAGACSSAFSDRPAERAATTSRGNLVADISATPKIAAEYSRVGVAPKPFCRPAAGSTAAKPTRPEIRPSFEFASTNSSSLRTVDGTRALFEIA
jgi:hypothetical protein